jgi:hypothetical protein
MAEAFAALGKGHKAAEVMLRLAEMVEAAGPTARDEARRIVHRGVMWDPHNSALLALQRRYDDRPRAVAREIVVGRTPAPPELPPLDLSEFVEVAPYEQSVVELSPLDYAEVYDEPSPAQGLGAPLIPFPV